MRHVQHLQNSPEVDEAAIHRYKHEADTSTLAMKRICHLYAATGTLQMCMSSLYAV